MEGGVNAGKGVNMGLVAIAVDPIYQVRGVGSALIRYGTGIADQEGVYCWVHASEAGWSVFEKGVVWGGGEAEFGFG